MSDQPTIHLPPASGAGPGDGPEPPRRRAWRAALIAALVTLILAVPAAFFLILRSGDGTTAEPGTPAPSTPGSTAPSTGPSATPPTSKPAPPDGRISLSTLQNATLDIPAWPTDNVRGASGLLRFRDGVVKLAYREAGTGQAPYGERMEIGAVTYGDLDRDGADETIAEIRCGFEGGSIQLIAFDRDRAGRIVTMGTVVATTGPIRDIRADSALVSATGTVTVSVGDYQVCCGDETPHRWQTRGYHWRDGRFRQVSGPTVMPVNPALTETRVSAGELVLGPVVGGYRYGTMAVTIAHSWATRPAGAKLIFYLPAGLKPVGTAWPDVNANLNPITITVTPPPTRGTVTYRFPFRAPADQTTFAHLDVELQATSAKSKNLNEAIPWNNTATSRIRTVD